MNIVTSIALVLVTILVGYVIGKLINDSNDRNEAEIRRREEEKKRQLQLRVKEKEEKRKQTEEHMRQLENKHNSYVLSMVEKYGKCDKTIKINSQRPFGFNEILVFSQTKHVIIVQKEYSFSDILDCIVNDDVKERDTVQTFRGNSTATSKANTGNMVGRAIVGGVLLGGAGAVIGGSTAKRNTIIEHGTDTSIHHKEIEHNYTVTITVKDITNPIIYINVGSNTALKDEIVSLMKVIMSMK